MRSQSSSIRFWIVFPVFWALVVTMTVESHAKGLLPKPAGDSDFFENGQPDAAKVTLGKFLFFDKILSGNKNISCATCHHPLTSTCDGLSLPVGEGGRGLGVMREPLAIGSYLIIDQEPKLLGGIRERAPRSAPPIWNLGAREFVRMFYDGRVEVSNNPRFNGFQTPAGEDLPPGLDNALAAQAMFPVTSLTEMAGQPEDHNPGNEIAPPASNDNFTSVWKRLADRLRQIDEYVDLFKSAYPEIKTCNDITFVHAANAIAAFEAFAWRADNSPFDRYLRGEKTALTLTQKAGMRIFYSKGQCFQCHSGTFQTDHDFHAIAMPQIGPGRGGMEPEDIGRGEVIGPDGDYQFRTPSLRNVALTGPWGHDGAYNTLEATIDHHLNPIKAYDNYDRTQAILPSQNRDDLAENDFAVLDTPDYSTNIKNANELDSIPLSKKEIQYLIDFLHALTDPDSLNLRSDQPLSVPSGLPIAD